MPSAWILQPGEHRAGHRRQQGGLLLLFVLVHIQILSGLKEGDAVKKGQTIGIIEAMKLLNEVEADQDGIVKSFCVENGQPVEFGQPLLVLE